MPWPQDQPHRLGAVSAFGFGGANAHMVFGQAPEKGAGASPATIAPGGFPELAVTAMDAHFGACSDLDGFLHANYEGRQQFIPLPAPRWKGLDKHPGLLQQYGLQDGKAPKGAYIRDFDLDFLRFKIPPNPDDQLIPQQMLAMKVADKAIQRAGLKQGQNVAVLVAMGAEPELHRFRARVNLDTRLADSLDKSGLSVEQKQDLAGLCKNAVHNPARVNQYTSFIGNIMAARIASLWDFSGPACTISSEENSVFRAVEIGALMLEKDEVEAVVVGAVDLSGSAENVLWRSARHAVQTGRATLSFDKGTRGWMPGEGAGAIVLKRADKARKAHDPVLCLIRSLAFEPGQDARAVEQAAKKAVEQAGISFSAIGYVEACASGMRPLDQAEAAGLQGAYGPAREPFCALGSAKALFGHCFAASQMASIIRTALCVGQGFLPRTPGWSGPQDPHAWKDSGFFIPERSQPWFTSPHHPVRTAAVSGLGMDGCASHMILAGEGTIPARDRGEKTPSLWNAGGPFLVPLAGDGRRALEQGLDLLIQDLDRGIRPAACPEKYAALLKPGKFSLALVGSTRQELLSEADAARQGMARALETGQDWFSPRGSAFSPKPMGPKAKVAFVYPGGFSSYPQMGRDFFPLFPQTAQTALTPGSDLGDLCREKLLYPRGMTFTPPGRQTWDLEQSAIAMFESGILFAISRTDAVRGALGIAPYMALGYSMGEISMLYSLGVWTRTSAMSAMLRKSPVFQTRLAGPMETVRKAWGLPAPKSPDDKIWHCFALKTSPQALRRLLEPEKKGGRGQRVFHTFTNTPNEVVIAGNLTACMRVIQKAGCEYFEAPMGDAIHCDIVRADYNEMVRLHTLDVTTVPDVRFLTAVGCGPLTLEKNAIARNIAEMYCSPVDFSSLVQKAHDRGVRVFIELGPRENCTQYIGQILAGKDHVAVATDRKGAGCRTSLVRAAARLFSHQIPMNLQPVTPAMEPEPPGPRLMQTVTLGGEDMAAAIQPQAARLFHPDRASLGAEKNTLPGKQIVLPGTKNALPGKKNPEPVQALPRASRPGPVGQPAGPVGQPPGPVGQPPGPASPRVLEAPLPVQAAYEQNQGLVSLGHRAFLRNRAQALEELEKLIRVQTGLMAGSPHAVLSGRGERREEALSGAPVHSRPQHGTGKSREEGLSAPVLPGPPARPVIWDRQDLETFAKGSIARVFGPEYG